MTDVVANRASSHRSHGLPSDFKTDSSVERVAMMRDEGLTPIPRQIMQ